MRGKCLRCGKPLSDPESLKRGYGPVCAKKLGLTAEVLEQAKDDDVKPVGLKGAIFLTRNVKGEPVTNVTQRIVDRSPDGFEWGYGGSGPADLALNILSLVLPKRKAYELHQDFKWEFIATMPEKGGIIKKEDIIDWIEEQVGDNHEQ